MPHVPGIGGFVGQMGAAGPALTFIGYYGDTSNAAAYSWGGLVLPKGRLYIAGAGIYAQVGGRLLNSMTVNGVAMTLATAAQSSSNRCPVRIGWIDHPGGATGAIALNFNGSMEGGVIAIWLATDYVTATALGGVPAEVTGANAISTALGAAIVVGDYHIHMAVGEDRNDITSGTTAWASADELFDQWFDAADRCVISGAMRKSSGAFGSGYGTTATWTVAPAGQTFDGAAMASLIVRLT